MTIYNWLSLLGVPALILGIVKYFMGRISKRQIELAAEQERTNNENNAIKAGIQAMLRDRLYQLYRYCKKQGYAGEFERENFDNMYTQYHSLGANGVMDDVKAKFLALPLFDEE